MTQTLVASEAVEEGGGLVYVAAAGRQGFLHRGPGEAHAHQLPHLPARRTAQITATGGAAPGDRPKMLS